MSKRKDPHKSSKSLLHIKYEKAPIVSVIIPVFNERKTIASVIRQAFLVHPSTEVIVVANGSTDGSERIAKRMGATVLSFDRKLGHDVGRSVGARTAKGSILLFMDGDIVIPANKLQPFVEAVRRGVDVALNSYLGPANRNNVHKVILAKYALNHLLFRPDLKGVSMTTIPHAISRKALDAIGAESLAVPPKAQAIALQKGLHVAPVQYVNVGSTNRQRQRGNGTDPLGRLIVGDHVEALHWVLEQNVRNGADTDYKRLQTIMR